MSTHHGIVIYSRRIRDLFRKRYWAVCTFYNCNAKSGPFKTKTKAWKIADGW